MKQHLTIAPAAQGYSLSLVCVQLPYVDRWHCQHAGRVTVQRLSTHATKLGAHIACAAQMIKRGM